jgi:Na+/H+ antiporter NhaC
MTHSETGRGGYGLQTRLCRLVLLFACCWPVTDAAAQETNVSTSGPTTQGEDSGTGPSAIAGLKQPEAYGLWVLTPALVAIGLAIATRRVVVSLGIGILVASWMLVPCLTAEQRYGATNHPWAAARVAVQTFLFGALNDASHIKVLVFTSIIGAMVGIIGASGGTTALVDLVARRAISRRGGQLFAWFAGLIVFFDDYANSMIVGPAMRPVFDRLKVSRAKLAYIVDSTAAPVASIALIGTWLGAEIGFIQAGLDGLASHGAVPEFLTGVTAWKAFLWSLPYRFYPIFTLVLVVLLAASGRDFGAMLRAERKALAGEDPDRLLFEEGEAGHTGPARWWLAGWPLLALILVTFGILFYTGFRGIPEGEAPGVVNVLANSDAYGSILYGAIVSGALAILLSVGSGALSLSRALFAAVMGVRRVAPALIVLVLAWALSASSQELHLGQTASHYLIEAKFTAGWLPLAIFISAAVVSFATGTSWGTMGILCPVVVTVAARLAADMPSGQALELFYAAVGSVLAGAIFGDHCSPISDTTVLSAIASGCTLQSHVWTQLPYAVTAALAEMIVGDFMCGYFGLPWYVAIGLGCVCLAIVVRLIGRRAEG